MPKTRKNNAAMRKTRKNNDVMMRKTRKQTGGKRPLSKWNKFVKSVYDEMKKKKKDTMFKDALVEAARRKKAGNMK